ncbi:MAG: hypothetical protein NTV51_24225 [Verrucomicrobia bacterium]|nr:hypothetical protein [Verrucomicrobiota bacterium]
MKSPLPARRLWRFGLPWLFLMVLLCGAVRAAEAPSAAPRPAVTKNELPIDSDAGDLGVGGFALIVAGLVALSMLPEVFRRAVVYSATGRRTIWFSSGRATGPAGEREAAEGGRFSGGGAGGNW